MGQISFETHIRTQYWQIHLSSPLTILKEVSTHPQSRKGKHVLIPSSVLGKDAPIFGLGF